MLIHELMSTSQFEVLSRSDNLTGDGEESQFY